jgi:hypothetical protein
MDYQQNKGCKTGQTENYQIWLKIVRKDLAMFTTKTVYAVVA